MKNIALFSTLVLAFFLGGCSDDEEVNQSIELACPRLEQTVKDNVVTIKWQPIAKTEGYAYKLDNADYVQVGADVTAFSSKVANGTHVFSIYAVGNNDHTTDSAVRTLEFEMDFDPTLPMPEPSANTEGTETTISWNAVPRAAGYAYKLDGAADFTRVGADVLSYTADLGNGSHTFLIYALGDGVDSEDSPVKELKFDVMDTSRGVFVRTEGGAITELEETAAGIFTASVECSKSETFVILVDGDEYGFTAYSGNGGVGTVNNLFASVPFYNGVTYYVRESLGRMSLKPEGGSLNKFYVNTDQDCRINVRVDRTNADAILRYYIALEQTPDPSIVLAQYFDLMVYGGDWPNYIKGSAFGQTVDATVDGTDPGDKGGAAATGFGALLASSSDDGVEAYMANRGLTGWTASNIYEFASCIRLGHSSTKGKLTTPKLTSLDAGAMITVTFDGMRFASKENIAVKVLNAGRIASASVNVDGGASPTAIAVEADNASFNIIPAHNTNYANADKKSWSNFTFVVEGATAETQICWDATGVKTTKEGRYMLDNIVIRK